MPTSPTRRRREIAPKSSRWGFKGARNIPLLGAIVGAVLLPVGWRELAMIGIGVSSYFATPQRVHEQNGFSFGPILEVAILFAGLFACLVPLQHNLIHEASSLPIQRAWQLFWGAGVLSSVLDNAPTYAAFTALAQASAMVPTWSPASTPSS